MDRKGEEDAGNGIEVVRGNQSLVFTVGCQQGCKLEKDVLFKVGKTIQRTKNTKEKKKTKQS